MKRRLDGGVIILIALSMIIIFSSCATTRAKKMPETIPPLTSEQSILFGYIEPNTMVYFRNAKGIWIANRGSHGGLVGAIIRTASPPTLTMNFRNVESQVTYKIEVLEKFEGMEFFSIALPKGKYTFSIKHHHEVSSYLPLNISENGHAYYIGHLSIWHSEISRQNWLQCEYSTESVKKFSENNYVFKDKTILLDTACGEKPILSSKVIGRWQGIDVQNKLEVIEFRNDGSVYNYVKDLIVIGNYRLLQNEEKIIITYKGGWGALGPVIVQIMDGNDLLTMTMPDRTVFKYKKL